ncbi:MAG TPA: alpha/beta fold hydrolase [Acidimicrobiales bacterium]|jgi:pimeloyl-ACP methyl ester carboxylesterase
MAAEGTGDLPAVLLLHGFATSAARTWGDNGWIDLVGDMGRTVLAPDLLGHGTSPKPHDPEAYADLGGPILEVMPDEPVDAIGFSLGARVLLEIAVRHPERFRKLVLSGVGANLFRTEGSDLVRRALQGDADLTDPVARYFATLASEADGDPVALDALLQADHLPLTAENLAAMACPTLVVLGEHDFAGPADPLVDALPDAQLVMLPRTDHFATPKDFRFIDAALDFINGDT